MVPSILRSITIALGAVSLAAAQAFEPGFPYGSEKVRGVNLGGWLVLEVLPTVLRLFESRSL